MSNWFCKTFGIFCPPRPTVVRNICLNTNLLSNPYCTNTADRRFYVTPKPGEPVPPTTVCALHHAPSPLPPKNSIPTYVFVPELLVARGDINAYLKKVRAAGAWGVRFFLLQSWSTIRLVPWLQAEYDGQKVWVDIPGEGVHAPVSDLTLQNHDYWARLWDVLKLIKDNDLEAVCSLGDNCSMNTHQQFFSYPFLGGLQTMSREEAWLYVVPQAATSICKASRGGLYGPDKYPYFQDWIKEAIVVLDSSVVKYHVEIQNEFSRLGWTDKTPENWYVMCGEAAAYPVKMINSGDYPIINKYPGLYSLHGVAKPTFPAIPSMNKKLTMLSGDGAQGNSTTDIDVKGRHGLSLADAKLLAQKIRDEGWWGIELMSKTIWGEDDCLANVDLWREPEIIEAFK